MKFMYRALVAVLVFSGFLSLHSSVRAATGTNEASSASNLQSPVVGSATGANVEHRVGRFRKRMQIIAHVLNLTVAQKQQLKPIIQAAIIQRKAIRWNTSLTREQKKEQLKALHTEMAPKIKAILTPEQLEKWKMLRQRHNSQQGTTPSASTPPRS